MSAGFYMDPDLDYANDWAGECRVDPIDGNAYVLRQIQPSGVGSAGSVWGYVVKVNDIHGGHERILSLADWMMWKRAPDA